MMPYYHKKCNGKISLWSRKCSKCGKVWPISAWFKYPPPRDMTKFIVEAGKKKPQRYAGWADRLPFVNVVARILPNWPRWARILTFSIVLGMVAFLIVRGFWR